MLYPPFPPLSVTFFCLFFCIFFFLITCWWLGVVPNNRPLWAYSDETNPDKNFICRGIQQQPKKKKKSKNQKKNFMATEINFFSFAEELEHHHWKRLQWKIKKHWIYFTAINSWSWDNIQSASVRIKKKAKFIVICCFLQQQNWQCMRRQLLRAPEMCRYTRMYQIILQSISLIATTTHETTGCEDSCFFFFSFFFICIFYFSNLD